MSKRILVVSPVPTHPTSAGNRARVASLIMDLKNLGNTVHFAHIKREIGDEEAMRNFWGENFHSIPYRICPPSFRSKVTKKMKAFIDPNAAYTFTIDEWYDENVKGYLLKLQNCYRFDVVCVEYVFFSKALECFGSDVLKLIDTHDVFTERHKVYIEHGQKPNWFSTSWKQESKGLNRADTVIAIQDHERVFLAKLCERPVVTVGHTATLIPPTDRSPTKNILYIGSHNRINIQSINFFASDIFPEIRARVPEAKLVVAGSVCDEVNSGEGIVKLGQVNKLEETYTLADVVVNPMLYGTGLKVKNIEALGYSKPLVTSLVGAEGLEDGSGSAFLVADTKTEWTESVIKVLQDQGFNQRLKQQAYEFAQQWNKAICHELDRLVQSKPHYRGRPI